MPISHKEQRLTIDFICIKEQGLIWIMGLTHDVWRHAHYPIIIFVLFLYSISFNVFFLILSWHRVKEIAVPLIIEKSSNS